MRISDWSSDVCSSDLPGAAERIQKPFAAVHDLRRGAAFGAEGAAGGMCGVRPDLDEAAVLDHVDRAAAGAAERAETRDLVSARLSSGGRQGAFVQGHIDRKRVGWGRRVTVRVDCGGRRMIKQKKQN